MYTSLRGFTEVISIHRKGEMPQKAVFDSFKVFYLPVFRLFYFLCINIIYKAAKMKVIVNAITEAVAANPSLKSEKPKL